MKIDKAASNNYQNVCKRIQNEKINQVDGQQTKYTAAKRKIAARHIQNNKKKRSTE